jgi:hypothetical protein
MLIGTAGVLGGHLWHILALGSWVPMFGLIVALEKWKARSSAPTARGRRGGMADWPLVPLMAVAAVCSALVHLAVMPDHLEESVWYGAFFLLAAIGQLVLAGGLVLRPGRNLVLAGAIGSAVVVGLWLVSRTAGVPIGPDHGATEPFGTLDILASTAEAVSALAGFVALRAWGSGRRWPWQTWGVVLRGASVVCIVGTVITSVVSSRS